MAQGSGGLSREMRELSEKLGAAHQSAAARREAAGRGNPSARKIQVRLFAIVFGLITVETLAGFLFFGFPGFAVGARNASGSLAYLIPAAMFGLTLLITLVILAAARMQRRQRGRLLTASASGVVTGTDIVQSTLASGKVGYLTEVNYVYEVGREKYTGAWRPRNIAHRVQRKLDGARAAWPPGKVAQVYYDPANPADSSLSRGSGAPVIMALWLGIFVATLAVSAGNMVMFIPLAPVAALVLGFVMVFGVSMQYHHV